MMKKPFLLLTAALLLALSACGGRSDAPAATEGSGDVMTYEEYVAAELDTEVVVETYVQAKQRWADNKATFYTQSEDGGYFLYDMACSREEYDRLTPGTKIRVTGHKSEWTGEVEIIDATYELQEGRYIASPVDVTALLGTDELVAHQNTLVSFRGMIVMPYDESGAAFAYKNETAKSDDLYFKVAHGSMVYNFCVESHLCAEDSDVYRAVESLEAGDVIDMVGFLYWYDGANPHITSLTKVG